MGVAMEALGAASTSPRMIGIGSFQKYIFMFLNILLRPTPSIIELTALKIIIYPPIWRGIDRTN
jgi:hypothetical protein